VRLTGGASKLEGRVEVKHSGRWRPLCEPEYANQRFAVAQVVCRQLGMKGGAMRGRLFTQSAATPLATPFCAGSETGLLDCFLAQARCHKFSSTPQLAVACAGALPASARHS